LSLIYPIYNHNWRNIIKGKGLPQQAEVAQGVSGRLRPHISLTFGTKRVVGRQPYAPAASTTGEIPGTHFLEAESTPGHMVLSVATEKITSDTTGDRSRNLSTSRAVIKNTVPIKRNIYMYIQHS
jgi:hypothetical protein